MADISILSRLLNGVARNVDLSTNSLVVGSLKVGSTSPAELTKTILQNLIALQNGSDFSTGTNAHTHDGRYFTESELSSATSSSGSDLIGDDNTYSNFTPSAATVKGALAGIDAALATAGGNTFSDAAFRVYDDGDNTKQIALEASAISASTTRTITMPDANVDLGKVATAVQRDGSVAFTANQPMGGFKLTGLGAGSGAGDSVRYEQAILASGANAFAANQSMGGNKLTNVADPTSAQDAATKAYVDQGLMGVKPKQAVRVATTTAGTLATSFEAGDSIDGVTLVAGDRILIKDQAAPEDNGIYVVQASGAPVRATDFDSLSPVDEINGAWVGVQEGTANGGKVFIQYGTVATLGTDPINFTYFSDLSALSGGDMITLSGSVISVDLATVSGLESSNPGNAAGQLRVKLEASNPSLRITGSNELAAKLDAAGAIASGASGLAVQVDNSTIEINTNALRVKAAGITESHLAASVAGDGLTGGAGSPLAVGAGDGISVAANSVAVDTSAIAGSGLENDGSNNLRIATAAYDQSTITGGGGSAAAVAFAPSVRAASEVAGESFAATTLFAVRYGQDAETAGRMYKADKDATSVDNFYVIGLILTVGALSAADPMPHVYKQGLMTVTSHGFTVGKPVYLDASGALSSTAPSTANHAVVKVGMVKDANTIDVQIQVMGVN